MDDGDVMGFHWHAYWDQPARDWCAAYDTASQLFLNNECEFMFMFGVISTELDLVALVCDFGESYNIPVV